MRRQGISPAWWFQGLRRRLTGRSPIGEPRLIHRDPDLAVAWLPGSSTRLVLVFISIQKKRLRPTRLEFRGIASDKGRNHVLFINDRLQSWYSRPGQRDRIAGIVRRFVAEHGIEDIWSIGNSMGGYGAILFCGMLPITNVVAIVPQLLVTEEVLAHPVWDLNRERIESEVVRDLTPIMVAADCRYSIVSGDSYDDDILQMAHLRKALPDVQNIRIVIAPGQEHNVAKWLKEQGQLSKLVAALWDGDRQGLEDCSKALERPLDLTLA